MDEGFSERGVAEDPAEAAGDILRVVGADDEAGVADDLGEGAAVRDDHRSAARHCLQGREAEAFIKRRQGEGIGRAVERLEVSGGHLAEEGHPVL
jgi:hypothetical protein